MSQLTKGQLQGENAASFPNNNTNFITPALLREFNTDMIDSLALQSQVDAVSSSVNGLLVSSSKYATTGSNRFNGNQTISGSYYLDIGSTRIRDVENGITVFDSTGGLQVRNYGSNDLQLEQNAIADLTITNQLLDIHLYTPSGAIFLNDVDFEQYSASVDSRLNNAQGVQGATGTQGASGTNGTNGAQGIQGLQGIQGTQGIQGAFGQTGNAGIQGIQGITGVQGIIGTTGASGSQGVQGITGAGTQGATGAQGTAGAGTSISVQDEGSILGNATSFNFIGAGVTTTLSSGTASVTIPGGGGGSGSIDTGSFITTGSVGQLQAIKGTLGVSDITTLSTGSTPSTINSSTGTLLNFLYDDINFGANPSIGSIGVGWTMSGSGITDGTVTSAGYGDTGYEVNITSGNVVSGSSYIGTGPFVKGLIITGSVFSDSGITTPVGLNITNQDGTGVPYGAITFNTAGLDPTDIDTSVYFDGGANLRRLILGLSSYTDMYPGQTVPTIQGGGNYNAGFGSSNVSMTFFSSSIQNWKPTEFKAPVNITGSLTISGSSTTDLTVVGQIFVSSSATGGTTAPKITVSGSAGQSIINRNSINTRNTTNLSGLLPATIFTNTTSTSDEIGFSVDTSTTPNWSTGPAIYINNPTDTYPAVFGFQNKANYTDGRVAVLTPLSASAGFTASLQNGYAWVGNANNRNTQVATSSFGSAINTGSFATTGSNTFTGNQNISGNVTGSTFLATSNGTTAFIYNQPSTGSVNGVNATYYGKADFRIYQYNSQPYAFNAYLQTNQLLAYTGSEFQWGLETNGTNSIPGGGSTYFSLVSGSTINGSGAGATKVGLAYLQTAQYLDFKADSAFNRKVYINNGLMVSASNGSNTSSVIIDATVSAAKALEVTGSVDITGSLSVNGNSVATLVSNTFTQNQIVSASIYIAPNNNNNQLYLPSGSNRQTGLATLDGGNPGAVTVSNTNVTANSIIMLTKQTLTNAHMVAVSSKGSNTFTITSNGNGDSDVVAFMIINPS